MDGCTESTIDDDEHPNLKCVPRNLPIAEVGLGWVTVLTGVEFIVVYDFDGMFGRTLVKGAKGREELILCLVLYIYVPTMTSSSATPIMIISEIASSSFNYISSTIAPLAIIVWHLLEASSRKCTIISS